MKIFSVIALSLSLVMSGCAMNAAQKASITSAGTAPLDKKGSIELSGSGFAPNSDVTLLFTTKDGVESDIGYALKPAPRADDKGNWSTTWSYGRFVKKKLVDAGEYSLVATDDDFSPVTNTSITFTK